VRGERGREGGREGGRDGGREVDGVKLFMSPSLPPSIAFASRRVGSGAQGSKGQQLHPLAVSEGRKWEGRWSRGEGRGGKEGGRKGGKGGGAEEEEETRERSGLMASLIDSLTSPSSPPTNKDSYDCPTDSLAYTSPDSLPN